MQGQGATAVRALGETQLLRRSSSFHGGDERGRELRTTVSRIKWKAGRLRQEKSGTPSLFGVVLVLTGMYLQFVVYCVEFEVHEP